MKHLLCFSMMLLLLVSCKKNLKFPPQDEDYFYGDWQEVHRITAAEELWHADSTPLNKYSFEDHGILIVSNTDPRSVYYGTSFSIWQSDFFDDELYIRKSGGKDHGTGIKVDQNNLKINLIENNKKFEIELKRL